MPEYQQKIKKEVGRGSYAPILVPNCSKIARKVGCSDMTVHYLLNPSVKAKNQARGIRHYTDYYKTEEGNAAYKRARKKYRLSHYLRCQRGFKVLGNLEKLIENEFASS